MSREKNILFNSYNKETLAEMLIDKRREAEAFKSSAMDLVKVLNIERKRHKKRKFYLLIALISCGVLTGVVLALLP
jgi:predicted nucleic acid-binding Zn ribbon protein